MPATPITPLPQVTPEQRYAFKRKAAALAVGGRLWRKARIFRYGRAAVARLMNGTELWGFIDLSGQPVVPCRYLRVYDFRNRNYRSKGVFDPMEDEETRMWTTVITPGSLMGMIDADGREVIPCKFVPHSSGYDKVWFHPTPQGEFAPVQEKASGKYGIIDRSGNYTLPPTYDGIIRYDAGRQCFEYFSWGDKKRIYFDHKGNRLSTP